MFRVDEWFGRGISRNGLVGVLVVVYMSTLKSSSLLMLG